MELERLNSIHLRAHIVHSQLEQARKILLESGNESMIPQTEAHYFELLNRLYEEEYQLAKLMASSDIVIHAEGPAASESAPSLNVVSSLFTDFNTQLRRLAKSVMSLSLNDEKAVMKALDIRLTGMAPGSIYAGFSINPPPPTPLLGTEEEIEAFDSVKHTITSLVHIPNFSGNQISDDFVSAFPDPALRDTALLAAYKLSPTGKKGIHTIGISCPALPNKTSSLSVNDRVVLKEKIKNPLIHPKKKKGSFIGQLRSLDLDKSRVDLRNVPDIGTLRCVMQLTVNKARSLIGKTVKVIGQYETNPSSKKPRLMTVEEISVIENLSLDV